MAPLIKYWESELLYFLRQRVEMMKKTASQMNNLLRVNIPNEQSKREMKLAPSASSWAWKRELS